MSQSSADRQRFLRGTDAPCNVCVAAWVQTFFTSELVCDGDLAIISVVTRRTFEVEGVISVACCACAIHAFSTHTLCSLCPATTQGSQGPRRLRAGAPACKSVRGYGVANENSQITSSRNTHGQPPRTHFFLTFTALQYVLCSEKENNTLRSQSGLRLFFSSIADCTNFVIPGFLEKNWRRIYSFSVTFFTLGLRLFLCSCK